MQLTAHTIAWSSLTQASNSISFKTTSNLKKKNPTILSATRLSCKLNVSTSTLTHETLPFPIIMLCFLNSSFQHPQTINQVSKISYEDSPCHPHFRGERMEGPRCLSYILRSCPSLRGHGLKLPFFSLSHELVHTPAF